MTGSLQSDRWQRLLARGRTLFGARAAAVPTALGIVDAPGALRRCRSALMEFGFESDREFTALAKELGRFGGELSELRRQAEHLSAVIEDRDEDRALSAAYALYKGSVDLVHASLGVAVSEQEQMQAVEQDLLQACGARAHFERNDMMLRILTLNIRMEAVRLEPEQQSTFLNVAANIGEIAQKVLASSAAAFERIEHIVVEAAAERAELRRLEEILHQRAHRSVETIFQELEKLRRALEPCAERSRAIETHLGQTTPITLGMMMALQHQDIVRQKLEHIAVGFDDIGERLASALRAPGADAAFVHQAAAVQQAQLSAARAEIEKAGSEVTGGMEQLMQHGESVTSAYTAMETAVMEAFRDCRLADLYREQITELAGIAAQGQGTNEKVSQSVARIEEIVRLFSQEIARQEFDVKIVSLNAQIAAARLGSAEALNKLSEECSRVSDQIGQITADLTLQLDHILSSLQQISAQADSFLGIVGREKLALEQGAVTVSEQLHHLAEKTQADAARSGEGFTKLFGETAALLQSLHFPELVTTSFEPAERLCQELRERTAASAQLALDAAASAKLAAHRDRYTMEEERRAHAGALGGDTSAAAPAADVELFGLPEAPGGEVDLFDMTAPPEAASAPPAPPEASGAPAAPSSAPEAAEPAQKPPAPKPDLGPGIELF